jgi:argininosuccinate lyase
MGLAALTGMLVELTFDTDRMVEAADDPVAAATDLAEFLVRSGMPFRDAHAVVGDLVRRSLDDGDDLAALVAAAPRLGPEAAALLEPGVAVTMRTTRGAGGPAALPLQREAFAARLAEDHARR